jgi:monoterpene epsilon-lactone hydrolase
MSEEQKANLEATLRQRPFDLSGDLTALRAGFDEVMRHIPVAEDVEKTRIDFDGVGALEMFIRGTNSSRTILYFHGGVYVIGSADATVPLASDLARRFNAKVVSVDYRLAPENPHPAALEDAKAAYQGLLSQGIEPRNIALAGESAGAGLAIALMLTLRTAGLPMPSSAFLMSPYADLTLSGKSIVDKRDVDPLFTEEVLRMRVSDYVAGADPSNPLISPIYGDLSGLPPLLIQVGSHELLLSDAVRLAERAAEDDVAVILEVTPGVPHVFQGYAAFLDEGDEALNRAAEFLALQFSRPSK